MNITTDLREDYIWSDSEENWSLVASDDSEFTFFEFNKDFTMFKHTTASIVSAYIIKSSKYDEDFDQYTFDVTSDVGNEYLMIIDIKNNNIRFIGENSNGTFLVRHNIKKLWTNE
jgi:hypothetical protein